MRFKLGFCLQEAGLVVEFEAGQLPDAKGPRLLVEVYQLARSEGLNLFQDGIPL